MEGHGGNPHHSHRDVVARLCRASADGTGRDHKSAVKSCRSCDLAPSHQRRPPKAAATPRLVGPPFASQSFMPLLGHPASEAVIAAAIEVHRTLGPGLLESVYQGCLAYELLQREVRFRREVAVPVLYKGVRLECGFRADLVVEDDLIVEVKSVEALMPIHTAQVLTHLRLTGARQALLINFGQLTLKAGLRSYLGRGNGVPIGAREE